MNSGFSCPSANTVAMHDGANLRYLLTDHASTVLSTSLGSVVAVTNAIPYGYDGGGLVSQQRFLPFGQLRGTTPIPYGYDVTQTDYGFTGQRNIDAQGAVHSLGLMDYRARFYSSSLMRFTQPDSIIPGMGNSQAWNRYAYVYNRPTVFTDPSGHLGRNGEICTDDGDCELVLVNNNKQRQDYRDLTDFLVAASVSHANDSEISEIAVHNLIGNHSNISGMSELIKILGYAKFYFLVRDGARFDVKDKMLEAKFNPVKLGDNWYEYSAPGNFLYGFYGTAAGYNPQELHLGAGFAQVMDYKRDPKNGIGPSGEPYYGDTEVDYWAIEAGIYAYNRYVQEGKFTQAMLQESLDIYGDRMDVVSAPSYFVPRKRGPYAPDEFDQ